MSGLQGPGGARWLWECDGSRHPVVLVEVVYCDGLFQHPLELDSLLGRLYLGLEGLFVPLLLRGNPSIDGSIDYIAIHIGRIGHGIHELLVEVRCFSPSIIAAKAPLLPQEFHLLTGSRIVPFLLLCRSQSPENLEIGCAGSRS